ncbi:MAG: hypothetical protein ACOX4O_11455 [Eubacteriales bacterium]|jgi:hypothetical protein
MAEKLKPENREKWVCPLCHIDCDDRFCAMCGISKEIARQYDSLMEENTTQDEINDSTGDWPAVSASEQKNSLYRRRIREAERKARQIGLEETTDDTPSVPEVSEPAAEMTQESPPPEVPPPEFPPSEFPPSEFPPSEVPPMEAENSEEPKEPEEPEEPEESSDAQAPEAVDISSELDMLTTHKRVETPKIRLVKRTPYTPYRRPPRKDVSARKTPAAPAEAPSAPPVPAAPLTPPPAAPEPSVPNEKEPAAAEAAAATPVPAPQQSPESDEKSVFTDISAELDAITAKLTPRLEVDLSELSAFNDAKPEKPAPDIRFEPDETVLPARPISEPAEEPKEPETAYGDNPEAEPADEDFFEEYNEEPADEKFVQTVVLDIDFGGVSGEPEETPREESVSSADIAAEPVSEDKSAPAGASSALKTAETEKEMLREEDPGSEDTPDKAIYIETGSGPGLWKPAAIISILTSAVLMFALVFVYVKYAVLEPRYGSEAVNTRIGLSDIFPEEESAEVTALTDEEPAVTEEATTAPETEIPETEPVETTTEETAETTTEPETIPEAETVPDETAEPEPETAPEAYDIDDEAANRG